MLFREAFELMKQGKKLKLPSWAGYWYWSKDKQTIIMHTKDGVDMDIRETQIPDYTFSNIASDEWTLADSKNCPELGGEATFSFGEAINRYYQEWKSGADMELRLCGKKKCSIYQEANVHRLRGSETMQPESPVQNRYAGEIWKAGNEHR